MGRKPRTELRKLLFGQGVHARGRCLQLNLVATRGCEVELVPRDDLDRRPPRKDTKTKAAQQRRGTDVDPYHLKLAIPPHELDVRDPRQPPPAKVEDLRVEDVAREQELVVGKPILDRIGCDHDLFRERGDSGPRHPTTTARSDAHT